MAADVKFQISSVIVRHVRLGDLDVTSPNNSPRCDIERKAHKLKGVVNSPDLVLFWGTSAGDPLAAASPEHDEEKGSNEGADVAGSDVLADPRSAAYVRRCILERLRDLPSVSVDEASELGSGLGPPVSTTSNRSLEQSPQAQLQGIAGTASPPPSPPQWVPAPYPRVRAAESTFAVQYRLLKVKDVANEGPRDEGILPVVVEATSACHDLRLGPLRAHLTEALLEQLVIFTGVGTFEVPTAAEHVVQQSLSGELNEGKGMGDEATTALGKGSFDLSSSPPRAQGKSQRARRGSWSPLRRTGTHSAKASMGATKVLPPPIATSETSVHLALRSVEVALNVAAPGEDYQQEATSVAITTACHHPTFEDKMMFVIFSVDEVGMSGSESMSRFAQPSDRQREWHASAATRSTLENSDTRVCSLSLEALSMVFLDGRSIGEAAKPCVPRGGVPTSQSWSLVENVFAMASGIELPATQQLVRMGRCRMTAEVASKVLPANHSGGESRTSASHKGAARLPSYEIVFNASCESLCACACSGIALLVLEACALSRKIKSFGCVRDVKGNSFSREAVSHSSHSRWSSAWARGVNSSFEGISIGGVFKTGGHQFTGNVRRLCVGQVSGRAQRGQSSDVSSDAAVFEATDGSEALSFSVETFNDQGVTGISARSDFKSAVLDYAKIEVALRQVNLVLGEWKAGAATRFLGAGQVVAGTSTAYASPSAKVGRSGALHFDFRGTAVSVQLPFELLLQVDGVSVSLRRVSQFSRGRAAEHQRSHNRDMTIDLLAADVRVLHAAHGARSSPQDAQPPAIHCAARGIVNLKPSMNATSVSLDSEHVKVRLTPAFCASFGSFIRFMIGPPAARSSALGNSTTTVSTTTEGGGGPPVSFSFELRVREVIADFVTGPCSPWAIAANLIVGGVLMRQKVIAAAPGSPAVGSTASFEIAFDKLEGTQRREPGRNAPFLPQETVTLIGKFLKRGPGKELFKAWLAARKNSRRSDAVIVQPLVIALGSVGSGAATDSQALSVISTTTGSRERLMNSLTLRLAPTLLAFYPPVVRLLVGHYNRFGGQAFRTFRSRSDLPQKKVGVMRYDVDIRGSGAVLLASLAVGARGVHISAGQVTVKENMSGVTTGPAATQTSSWRTDGPIDAREQAVSMSGFVGPVVMAFVQDWRCLLPSYLRAASSSSGAIGEGESGGGQVHLCVPIDLRWTMCYDHVDRFRQDISLSSVQLYLEQSHFDLCARLRQIFMAADFPGALAPKSRPSSGTVTTTASSVRVQNASTSAADIERQPGVMLAENLTTSSATNTGEYGGMNSFLDLSLRLPLLQVVLAMGKRDGPSPPVLEIDIASIRLAQGGVFTVRHVSVNSWPQQLGSGGGMGLAMASGGGGSGHSDRVFERSGQSEESGKDFARMEVQVPTADRAASQQAKFDIVLQVITFGNSRTCRPCFVPH